MLIEKAPDINDIIVLKLVTSEELVAKIVDQTADTVTITKPVVLNIAVDEATRRPGIQMYPFFLLGANPEGKIPLKKIHILTLVPANDEIKRGYVANTSGLEIPGSASSGLIT